jgi:hypothetical protein
MMANTTSLIEQSYIQYGFAGVTLILLGIVVWMVRQLIAVINKNNKVLARVFDGLNSVKNAEEQVKEEIIEVKCEVRGLRDEIIRRPCITTRSAQSVSQ